jgi:FADH2 O2-dependent halogenase
MTTDFDIAVVGSGFAGSLMAMIARHLGRSVVLIERGRHPRFAIGESSTPLANLLLEELARRYDLPQVASLSKWGSWQAAHPEIGCGLKRGFTFFHHHLGEAWRPTPDRSNELLVAASPHDRIADTHWFRPDFDAFLARQAQELGVELVEEIHLDSAEFSDAGATLAGRRAGQSLSIRARFVIDATGPRGFLHRALALPESPLDGMPPTAGLFTHFAEVKRWDAAHPTAELPPFPVDDAAVHHLFDGGWIWVLRFNNGLTSAGVAATRATAETLNFAEGAPAWERLLGKLPAVREQFAGARAVRSFVHAPRLSFRSATAAGAHWALLPSAAGFVDPLLSTGFPLTLLGVARLASALEQDWNSPRLAAALANYSSQTLRELDATAALVGALYAQLHDFEAFAALTQLYFAAASFAESARRLGRPELATEFLLLNRAPFAKVLRDGCAAARQPLTGSARGSFFQLIAGAIEPINVAGLGDAARRNWYPALAADLLAAAPKLGAGREEMERLLARCGFDL